METGERENYSDKNVKGTNETHHHESLSEIKNKVLVKNVLITGREQILLCEDPALNLCEKMTALCY